MALSSSSLLGCRKETVASNFQVVAKTMKRSSGLLLCSSRNGDVASIRSVEEGSNTGYGLKV